MILDIFFLKYEGASKDNIKKGFFSCAMLSESVWANIAQRNRLWNVGPLLTDNFYEENNLYNVVSTFLGQHCIGILSSQCCPNTYEITLHKKITCTMLVQSTQTCFRKKMTYTMLSWFAWANIAQEIYLCNVDPQPMNNFSQKNNLQYYLDIQCWPTVNRQFFLTN